MSTAKRRSPAKSKRTTDHAQIRRWAEARGGRPAQVKGTGSRRDIGLLRIDFAEDDEQLEAISWDDFFETFEDSRLALVYQDETVDGGESRFSKLVHRDVQHDEAK